MDDIDIIDISSSDDEDDDEEKKFNKFLHVTSEPIPNGGIKPKSRPSDLHRMGKSALASPRPTALYLCLS